MKMGRNLSLFIIVIGLAGLAGGLSDGVFANYFKEVYFVNAAQRGFIEFPRELPGILGVIVISILMRFGDLKIALFSLVLSAFGILVLGFWTPTFNVMLIFLFIYSLGMHVLMPLQDSIALSLAEDHLAGKRLGQMAGIRVGFSLLASMVVFIGFINGWLNFKSPLVVFILAGIAYLVAACLLYPLTKRVHVAPRRLKFHLVVRKDYTLYYLLTILNGAQKQIMIVFAPWLLIELLGQGAATLALVSMLSALMGVFFLPAVGKWIDSFGIKKMMYADAFSFIFVYFFYGLLANGIVDGWFSNMTLPLVLACSMFVLDRLSMNLGMVRTMYLRNIAHDPAEITQTLSLGISLDHIVTIACASVSGVVWMVYGPQYVFYFASVLSLFNVVIAYYAKIK